MPDLRFGLPSASTMARLDGCPASWGMTRHLVDTPETLTATASGARIHAALASGDLDPLTPDEREAAEACLAQRDDVLRTWQDTLPQPLTPVELHEHRLGLTTQGTVVDVTPARGPQLRFTGQADVIAIAGTHGLVLDYKTAPGPLPSPADHAQLRALALLTARRWRLQHVRVAILRPQAETPGIADYDIHSLAEARAWLERVLNKAMASGPDEARPGDWCQHCRARALCPALREAALSQTEHLALPPPHGTDPQARAALFARARQLDNATLARLVRGLRLVTWYADAIDHTARKRAATDPDFQRHYTLKPPVQRERISDLALVWQRCESLGVRLEDFVAATTMTKADLEPLVRTATGKKGQSLKTEMARLLRDAVEARPAAPQLQVRGSALGE